MLNKRKKYFGKKTLNIIGNFEMCTQEVQPVYFFQNHSDKFLKTVKQFDQINII